MTERFNKIYNTLLSEMSILAKPIVNARQKIERKWNAVKDKAELMEDININGENLKVYLADNIGILYFGFYRDDILVAFIEGHIDKDRIHIFDIFKSGPFGFYMSDIFKQFLLNHFDIIESDDIHTLDGFRVYYHLVDDKDVKVSVIDNENNNEKEIVKPDDLKQYFGGLEKQKFTYKIEKR